MQTWTCPLRLEINWCMVKLLFLQRFFLYNKGYQLNLIKTKKKTARSVYNTCMMIITITPVQSYSSLFIHCMKTALCCNFNVSCYEMESCRPSTGFAPTSLVQELPPTLTPACVSLPVSWSTRRSLTRRWKERGHSMTWRRLRFTRRWRKPMTWLVR